MFIQMKEYVLSTLIKYYPFQDVNDTYFFHWYYVIIDVVF